MLTDRKKLHIVSFASLAVLLVALLLTPKHNAPLCAIILSVSALLFLTLIKKRAVHFYTKYQLTALMAGMGVFFVTLYFISGIFFGISAASYSLTPSKIFLDILPLALTIIASEVLRSLMLAQSNKTVTVVSYLICVVSEVLVFNSIPQIRSFNIFMELVGMSLLPSLVSNLLYTYISKRYGMYPNIAYRLITKLFIYVIPVMHGIPNSIHSLAKIFVPILIFVFIDALYGKKKRFSLSKKGIFTYAFSAITLLFIISTAMLISCRFHFGLIVIATPSMTGEINQGDAVIYEEYDGKEDLYGDVIIFKQNGSTIVHRVVNVEIIDNETRYTTKGDANEDSDSGYITKSNVVGVVRAKLPAVGYPSLWLRDLFSKKQ